MTRAYLKNGDSPAYRARAVRDGKTIGILGPYASAAAARGQATYESRWSYKDCEWVIEKTVDWEPVLPPTRPANEESDE